METEATVGAEAVAADVDTTVAVEATVTADAMEAEVAVDIASRLAAIEASLSRVEASLARPRPPPIQASAMMLSHPRGRLGKLDMGI